MMVAARVQREQGSSDDLSAGGADQVAKETEEAKRSGRNQSTICNR